MIKAESHQTRGVLTTGAQGPGGQGVLRTRILQPLGLTHTIFPTTAAMPSPHLHGYSVQGGPLTEVNTTTYSSCEWTAGAMISTLADLHTWAQAVATGRIGHAGELPGFNTDAWYLPALQATIVVIVNSDPPVQGQAPADHPFKQLAKIVSGLQRAA
jgi:D-alanyl-D-alanine carboxypeptidase